MKKLLLAAFCAAALLAPKGADAGSWDEAQVVNLAPVTVKQDSDAHFSIKVTLPPGWHVNAQAPLSCSIVKISGRSVFAAPAAASKDPKARRLPFKLAFKTLKGSALVDIGLKFSYCRQDGKGACKMAAVVLRQPVDTSADAPKNVALSYSPE